MGFKMPHIGVVVGIICIAVALLFQIIAVATTNWLVYDVGNSDIAIGFWEQCNNDVCLTIGTTNQPAWFDAARGFGILGMLAIAACLIVGVLVCFNESPNLPMIAMVVAFISAFCVMISFAVFAGEGGDVYSQFDFGYSFALSVVAFVLCLAAGVAFLLPKVLG